MRETRLIMGMPIEIEIVPTPLKLRGAGGDDVPNALKEAFVYLAAVDARFSTYKEDSEISHINRGKIEADAVSPEMREIFALAEKTRRETNGYFTIHRPNGPIDPSGIVKGWAIYNTAELIRKAGHEHFFVNAGGDIASSGKNEKGDDWSIGIRNPFKKEEIIKVVYPRGKGVATSGSYVRGDHIYNPHNPAEKLREIVSITVIGPDVLEADRFATAAFAMGKEGILFIEDLAGFEGYAIDANGIATLTSGFAAHTL